MNDIFNQQRFGGIRIVETEMIHPTPRMTLSPDVPVTAEFRAQCNAWMLKFFGVEYKAVFIADTLFVHPDHADELRDVLTRIAEGMKADADAATMKDALKAVERLRDSVEA